MAVHFTLNNDFILNFQQLLGHQTKVKTIAKNAISEKNRFNMDVIMH